jgi:hypothetical protein
MGKEAKIMKNIYKLPIMLMLVISIISLLVLPFQNGVFPLWLDEDMITLLLLFLCGFCIIALLY